MHPWTASVLSIALVAAWGCGPRVGSTHDPLVLFPAEATWAWDDAANRMPKEELVYTLMLASIIRETAAEALTDRGYVEAPPESSPQYLLSYDVGLGKVVSPTKARAVGSVSLRLVDARTGHRVWVGFARTDVDLSRTEAQRKERIRGRMRKMLKGFPPGH